jgi:predicted MFS family arabinose efflux permease
MSTAESAGAAEPVPNAAAAAGGRFGKGYRAWMLFLLLLVNALNLADRQGMAATAQSIRLELHLTGAQLGLIQGLGFAIFYTLFGLPLAWMAERINRTRLIAGSLAIFGLMVAACATIRSFGALMLFRIGVGIGDAGFVTPVASLVGDHYPSQKRASAMTVIWLGAPIGAVAGAVIAGWVAQTLGWRVWYYALGVPAIVVAALAFLTLREPVRGMSDAVAVRGKTPSIFTAFRFLLAKKSVWFILIGAGLAATGMNGLGQFFSLYLQTAFHVGPAEAGRLLGLMSGVAMASGLALGGFGVDWGAKFDRRWFVWGPALGQLLAMPLFFFGASQASIAAAVIVLGLGHVALFVYYTPTLALAQNMVGANMRASSSFVTSLVLGLVGIGLGPTLIGLLNDLFTQHAFGMGDFVHLCPGGRAPAGAAKALTAACSTAASGGIRSAIMAMSLLFGGSALFFVLASINLRKDLDTHYETPAA